MKYLFLLLISLNLNALIITCSSTSDLVSGVSARCGNNLPIYTDSKVYTNQCSCPIPDDYIFYDNPKEAWVNNYAGSLTVLIDTCEPSGAGQLIYEVLFHSDRQCIVQCNINKMGQATLFPRYQVPNLVMHANI